MRFQLADFKPLTKAPRLLSTRFAQVALGAAITQLEVTGIANAAIRFGMPDEKDAAASAQQRRNVCRAVGLRQGPADGGQQSQCGASFHVVGLFICGRVSR